MTEHTKSEPRTVTVQQLYVNLTRLDIEKAIFDFLKQKGYEPDGCSQVECSLCGTPIDSIDIPVKSRF